MTHLLIIPTFAREDLVNKCLRSIRSHEVGNDYRIIVADDGSGIKNNQPLENICKQYDALFYQKPYNEGFAKTVNYAFNRLNVKEPYITLVNNDVEFREPILDTIRKRFEADPKLGVIGGLLLYGDMTIQHGGMRYNETARKFLHDHRHEPHNFPSALEPSYKIGVTGALMTIRTEIFRKLKGLDERYFLACEDTEFCLRVWQNTAYKVLYEPAVKAFHFEGMTRGHDEKSKKAHPEWTKKEKESIKVFLKEMKRFNIRQIKEKIHYANRQMKIPIAKKALSPTHVELGSGYNPEPGFFHVDSRRGLPNLDLVHDIQKEKLPFKDGSVEVMVCNHVIEHISFRKLPFVLREWSRVMKKGGVLRLRTPDLEFICSGYMRGKTTPEHPTDVGFIIENFGLNDDPRKLNMISPSWWTNLKLFSGQDYDANFHHICFDFTMLRDALTRYGFSTVNRVKWEKEFSPGELQVEAVR